MNPMPFLIFGSLSFVTLAACITLAIIKWRMPYKRGEMLKPFHIIAAGVFIAGVFLFLPLYVYFFLPHGDGVKDSIILTIMMSIHNSIRLFMVDGDFQIVLDATDRLDNQTLAFLFDTLASVLFVAAPLMSATLVLSFFQSITSKIKYFFSFGKDVYIFSELNEKSLILAKSIKAQHTHACIIFTDVFKNNNERSFELIEQTKEIGAINFKDDITVVNFSFHKSSTKMFFFVMGNDESENIKQAITLASKPAKVIQKQRKNDPESKGITTHSVGGYDYPREGETRIFLCSTNASFEHQLNSLNTEYVKLRRVNEVQSLIYDTLFNKGDIFFDTAVPTGNKIYNPVTRQYDDEKLISVVIVGLGLHGTEMIKALVWFAQMHPYRLEINAFDRESDASSRFSSMCPDIMSEKYNGNFDVDGEAHYRITIHDGCDVSSDNFDKELKNIKNATYVLLSLSNDDLNIQTAVKTRSLLLRNGCSPVIQAIVYDPDKSLLLTLGREKGILDYDIAPIGDLAEHFSADCILASEIEALALQRHLKWGNEEDFWRSDYNYRSSTASVIHSKYKLYCNIPGSDKKKDESTLEQMLERAGIDAPELYDESIKSDPVELDKYRKLYFARLLELDESETDTPEGVRTPKESDFLCRIEHNRWNAYVRSEGYVYAPKRDKMAKTHHLLVPFDELPWTEQIKDGD